MIFLRINDKNKIKKNSDPFAVRTVVCYFLVLLMLLGCALRVADIKLRGYESISAAQGESRITVQRLRGTVYDCNMMPLTNNKKSVIALVTPTPLASKTVSSMLTGEEKTKLLNKLHQNKPAICEVPEHINCEGVATVEVYKTEGSPVACHVIGYLDNTGHGVAGLEAAYDGLLYNGGYLYAVYDTDGKGRPLGDSSPRFEGDYAAAENGVVSTIDIKIQEAAEEAASVIKRGAVAVSEVKTGEIKALLSNPGFDTSDISAYLEDRDSPFINRALLPYSVGSVFKTCVAAAGIENSIPDMQFNCTGSEFIVDRVFKCHNTEGHGTLNLMQALAFSCNCYFYNYGMAVGGEKIYNMARIFNFGSPVKIADNMKTAAGSLPDAGTLGNPARLANFSIGQGEFSASPVALLPLYTAVANGGRYYLPSLVKKTIYRGSQTDYDKGNPTVAMSEQTANTLKSYLTGVISEGTGVSAAPKTVTAAGKTATAQTGRVDENGKKINNSWFCGFFPAETPEYAVVILSEGGNTAETSAVFADIADRITELSNRD